MELKYLFCMLYYIVKGFNRTFMELKYKRQLEYEYYNLF